MDFLIISSKSTKRGVIEIYPKFVICRSKDLMIRGGDFYAIWDEELGLWSTDEQDAIQMMDRELDKYAEENRQKFDSNIKVLHLWDAESGMIDSWHKYCQKQTRDSFHMLDEKLIFSNTKTKKTDYASKTLDYPLEEGDISAYTELISTLYSEDERHKIEWAIGSIIAGDSRKIQKFLVLYGAAGTGKSTILNIIQQLFEGYYCVFDAKALGSSTNSFALEAFKSNPLVAIQHDGDLSRIEDNTRLNSLVSHEMMIVNEKFKSNYANRFKCFLFMGTNKPVKITDAKSGLIRRLIDVAPTGEKVEGKRYRTLVKQISFELGGIAKHCLDVYEADPGAYDDYVPNQMLGASNDFYNFVLDCFDQLNSPHGITLNSAWDIYTNYCENAKVAFPYSKRAFKEELKNYFTSYEERSYLEDGTRVRNIFKGFLTSKFEYHPEEKAPEIKENLIEFKEQPSIFDKCCSECLAQYATDVGTPGMKWDNITTKLSSIDTRKVHYVRVPENHIVIDFDIKDKDGNKCFEENLKAASKWPPTYAELSKSGGGIHLHYIYQGDPKKLSRVFDDNIEVKVFSGNSSLRRKLTLCNALAIAAISSGLPLKGEKMVNQDVVITEKGIRTLIKRNINKEIHPGTKPSIDFIYTILDDAYNKGICYDITDMRNAILAFAAQSTNHADYCIKKVGQMKFKSAEPSLDINTCDMDKDPMLIFFDAEVFPNLFLLNWKRDGDQNPVMREINPLPEKIEELINYNIVGFNNRGYDNHILYARMMHYNNLQLFNLSQKIINAKSNEEKKKCLFGEAYNISYTDIYDFSSKKQSLKKFEIELGIHHQELGLPWDQPVPEDKWETVAAYCDNDVLATEALFHSKDRQADFEARKILAKLATVVGGVPSTVNDTTNTLTARLIFGNNKSPQSEFNYRNLAEKTETATWCYKDYLNGDPKANIKYGMPYFPGYTYEYNESKKSFISIYREEVIGEGGRVYAKPGMYRNALTKDVASMHPHSLTAEKHFGDKYTAKFEELMNLRVAVKHKDYEKAKQMFGGAVAEFLNDEETAKALASALKIAINAVYGMTSAKFQNVFKDPRNKDNIVAKRGALFMTDLKNAVQERGFTVIHIKTDSIKIAEPTQEILDFVVKMGEAYGYQFETEAIFDKICLVNDAVYIGHCTKDSPEDAGKWTATGTQFAVPYVFKTLFSKEPIEFSDLCETKSVKSSLYLDMNEELPDVSELESEYDKLFKKISDPKAITVDMTEECKHADELAAEIEKGHSYRFIGKVGQFCPVKPGYGGGILVRDQNGKYYSVTGTKGYRWLESEVVSKLETQDGIDKSYYDALVNDAVETISKYGDFEWFISNDEAIEEELPFN